MFQYLAPQPLHGDRKGHALPYSRAQEVQRMAHAAMVRYDEYLDTCAPQSLHHAVEGVVGGGVVIHGDDDKAQVVECRHVEERIGAIEGEYGI